MTESPPALRLEGVTTGYGGRPVLRELTLSVRRGELVGVIGPNGSGKSTLLKTLSGWLPVQSGQALVEGLPVGSYSASERARRVAVVAQHLEPTFAFSVWDLVTMGRYAHQGPFRAPTETDRAVVERSLERTGCTHLRNRLITELSGGELQRVIIARALAQQSPILLLDEPTSHLDLQHQLRIARLLRDLHQQEGLTVLWVSHDLNLASEFCDRLILLNQGRIEADGPPEAVVIESLLWTAYEVEAPVQPNPLSGRPHVLFTRESLLVPPTGGDG